MKTFLIPLLLGAALVAPAQTQSITFDFENARQYAPLPINLTVDGLSAHFSATGQGYSIQRADVLGFTPVGFSGLCIYPSSVYAADLLVSFSAPLKDFSIMYSPEEYGCDSSARMRVTAYLDNTYVGTNTTTADPPGTWPTGILTFATTATFNRVVVHYDAPPPTGGDYGPIFMADNMIVTPAGNSENLFPISYTVGPQGKEIGTNDVTKMQAVDNNRAVAENTQVANPNIPAVRFNVDFKATKVPATKLQVIVTTQTQWSNIEQRISMLKTDGTTLVRFDTYTFTTPGSDVARTSDTNILGLNPMDFVNVDGTAQVVVQYRRVGVIPGFKFQGRINAVELVVSG